MTDEAAQRDVDAVLRRIPVLALYRANLFRIAGIPTDAGTTAVRRRREELAMAARLGTAVPSPWGELALEPDADTIKNAFEALTAPLTRLVHETFWLTGEGGVHDDAIAAHCRALEHDGDWDAALAAWARALDDDAFWHRLEDRAKDLDDPRVGVAHARALRVAARGRVLAPSAHLAVVAAQAGDEPGVRAHLRHLADSPFDYRAVRVALREACAPTVDRLHDQCATVLRAATEEEADAGLTAASALLETAPTALAVLHAVLPDDDPLPAALHDEIATAVVRAAVAHVNAGGPAAAAAPLLAGARDLARDQTARSLVDRTAGDLAEAEVRAVIKPWLDAGDPDGAVEVLRQWAGRTEDHELRRRLHAMADDPRAVRAELSRTPTRSQFLGCGVRPFGRRAEVDDTWVETRCVTVFWIPVHALASYLTDEDYVYAKVPFSPWVRRLRVAVPAALVLGLVLLVVGIWVDLALVAALAVALGAAALSRRQAVRKYLDEELHVGEVRYG
ncbi:MAG: hypothetical protein ACT4QG_15765 [Sporichthyaceae bacterium]